MCSIFSLCKWVNKLKQQKLIVIRYLRLHWAFLSVVTSQCHVQAFDFDSSGLLDLDELTVLMGGISKRTISKETVTATFEVDFIFCDVIVVVD